MLAEEILRRYVAGERNFAVIGANFIGANLQEVDLSEISLVEPIFTGANLSRANLKNSDLKYAHIDNCNLTESNLEAVNLSCAKFQTAALSKANLYHANLSQSELIDVDLSGANLSHANLSNALLNCVDLRGANLSNVEMTGAKLRGSNLVITTEINNLLDAELLVKLWRISWNTHLFYSDGDYNLTPFVWEIPHQEVITGENILRWGSYSKNTALEVNSVSWFSYPSTGAGTEKYNALIETFRNELKDTKIYWLAEDSNDISGTVDAYVVGKTSSGNFAGVAAPRLAWT